MIAGVKYLCYPDHSGYGLAALAYVRALHNAGVPVWWAPLIRREGHLVIWQPTDGLDALPLAWGAEQDAALQDLAALAQCAGPKAYDTLVMHTVPELWPALAEPRKRQIGYTVWECDALPAHWRPLLDVPDKVLVPCAMNQSLFRGAGVTKPVRVVPHVRRHAWNPVSAADVVALRQRLRIPEAAFVFYTIGVWDPRKALDELVVAFAQAFSGHDRVTLVIKTSTRISELAFDPGPPGGIRERVHERAAQTAARWGRPPPQVVVIPADGVAGHLIDALHALGDCYVSLTHGEGWGMGAFDAACSGKPVLIPGFGGPIDYLGPDYPGLIDYRMVPVSGWRPEASYQPFQRWAQADAAAVGRLLRRMVARYGDFLEPAARLSERLLNRYAEPVVARKMLSAIYD